MYGKNATRKSFIEFFNFSDATRVYNFYNVTPRRALKILNFNQLVNVDWGIDRIKMPENNWSAVVVRNLPPNCQVRTIIRMFTKNGEKLKSVCEPEMIRGIFVIMKL